MIKIFRFLVPPFVLAFELYLVQKGTHHKHRVIYARPIVRLHDDVISLLLAECPSFFCFLVQIRTIVASLGLPNLNMKRKTKWMRVVVLIQNDAIVSMAY